MAQTLARWRGAFPPGYRDRYDAAEALADLAVVDDLSADEQVRVRAFRHAADDQLTFRFKLYRPGAAAPLADVLPILENMGLKALIEDGFKLDRRPTARMPRSGSTSSCCDDQRGEHLSFADIKRRLRGRLRRRLDRPHRERRLQPPGAGAGRRLARGGPGPRPGPLSPADRPGPQPGGCRNRRCRTIPASPA